MDISDKYTTFKLMSDIVHPIRTNNYIKNSQTLSESKQLTCDVQSNIINDIMDKQFEHMKILKMIYYLKRDDE